MDTPTVLKFLDDFASTYAQWKLAENSDSALLVSVRVSSLRSMREMLPVLVRVLDAVVAGSGSRLYIDSDGDPSWSKVDRLVTACRGELRLGAAIDLALAVDENPKLDAGSLHHAVWQAAQTFWESGHRREAVATAAKAVNAYLQKRVGRRDVVEAVLVQQSFSADPPTESQPRLRMPPFEGGPTQRSRQSGALQFGAGCFQAIRNPLAHEYNDAELDEHLALEHLAALSVFARWIDEARIERVDADGEVSVEVRSADVLPLRIVEHGQAADVET